MAAIETPTKTGLISKAALLIGEKGLNALTNTRFVSEVGGNTFELLYEAELQSNRWRFAMTKRALSRLTDVPLNEYQYAFQIPSDCLLPIGVWPAIDYEIYGDRLYTDEPAVTLEMLFKPDVGEIPAYFALLMVCVLARRMIKPVTEESGNAFKIMDLEYVRQRNRAEYADAQGRPARPINRSPFTDVR